MKKWVKMILLIVMLWGFINYVPKLLNKIEAYQKFQEASTQYGIDNSALFYSEEPLTFEAEISLKRKLRQEK